MCTIVLRIVPKFKMCGYYWLLCRVKLCGYYWLLCRVGSPLLLLDSPDPRLGIREERFVTCAPLTVPYHLRGARRDECLTDRALLALLRRPLALRIDNGSRSSGNSRGIIHSSISSIGDRIIDIGDSSRSDSSSGSVRCRETFLAGRRRQCQRLSAQTPWLSGGLHPSMKRI